MRDQSVAPSMDTLMIRGCLRECSRKHLNCLLEVVAVDVRAGTVVVERLNENELAGATGTGCVGRIPSRLLRIEPHDRTTPRLVDDAAQIAIFLRVQLSRALTS
jgi:hypothetical protein